MLASDVFQFHINTFDHSTSASWHEYALFDTFVSNIDNFVIPDFKYDVVGYCNPVNVNISLFALLMYACVNSTP